MVAILIGFASILQLLFGGWPQALTNHLVATLAKELPPAQLNLPVNQIATPVSHGQVDLNLTASNAVAIDAATGQILYAKNPDQPHAIASITKIFTVLVILRDHSLDEIVSVPQLPAYTNGAVALGLKSGQQFKLEQLLRAALIPSANDAADTLAIWDAGSVPAFTAKMNQLMAVWGIPDLHFNSANGLEDNNNFASAMALTRAARLLLTNTQVKAITAMPSTAISDLSGQKYQLTTTNELLKEPGFSGIKTGYTLVAGQCLLARASVQGHDVITVVLGSQDRFGETRQIINAIDQAYKWQ